MSSKFEKQVDINKKIENELRENSSLEIEELFKKYKTSYEGISVVELDDRTYEYGKNIIDARNSHTIIGRIKESIINPFNMVLIVIAIITFITDIVISNNKDYATFILIVTAILTSSIISFVQQAKSDKAAKKLQNMISNKITVIRDDILSEVPVEEIFPRRYFKAFVWRYDSR